MNFALNRDSLEEEPNADTSYNDAPAYRLRDADAAEAETSTEHHLPDAPDRSSFVEQKKSREREQSSGTHERQLSLSRAAGTEPKLQLLAALPSDANEAVHKIYTLHVSLYL